MEAVSMKIIKYLIFCFNLVVFIIGLVFIIAGAVIQAAFKDYFAFFGNEINSASMFIIIIGVVCLIVSFFGCCGAYKENHCMVITFAVALSIVLLLEIAAAITAFVLRSEVETYLRDAMKKSIPNYQNEGVDDAWDQLQTSLECCGVDSYRDWADNSVFDKKKTVPQSCCLNSTTSNCAGKVLQTHDTIGINVQGCADELIEWSTDNIAIIGSITIVFAVIQVVGIVLACILAGDIRKNYQPV